MKEIGVVSILYNLNVMVIQFQLAEKRQRSRTIPLEVKEEKGNGDH